MCHSREIFRWVCTSIPSYCKTKADLENTYCWDRDMDSTPLPCTMPGLHSHAFTYNILGMMLSVVVQTGGWREKKEEE